MTDTTYRKEAPVADSTGRIVPVPAPSEGGLPGYEWTCPTCGMVLAYSLETLTASEVRLHLQWHEGRR